MEEEEQEVFLQLKVGDRIIKIHRIYLKFGYLALLNTKTSLWLPIEISTVRFS